MNRFILFQSAEETLGNVPPLIWVTLLARAIASHLKDWAVVVNPAHSAVLHRPGSEPVALVHSRRIDALVDEVSARLGASPGIRAIHFLILQPAGDSELLEFVGGERAFFHVVTTLTPYADRFAEISASILSRLRSRDGRVVPAVLLPPEVAGGAGPLSFHPIEDDWRVVNPLDRDHCRLRVKADALFIAALDSNWSRVDPRVRTGFERWARTIAGRRVGITMSGGGAAIMRLVPLFEALEKVGVPIDLLSGASGSVAFSACYATGGIPRILALAERGLSILLTATTKSLLHSAVVEEYLDAFWNECGICNTEIRVIPLATALAPNSPPRPMMVVDGSFGQAARASGTIPLNGPFSVNGTRYIDGSVVGGLPPPNVMRQLGAEFVIAMNVLAVPANRYPGENHPTWSRVTGFLYDRSILGRYADTISAVSTLLHTMAEGHGRTADIFVDAPPRNWAMFEPPMLFRSLRYAREGLGGDVDVTAIATHCLRQWQNLP